VIDLTTERALQLVSKILAEESEQQQQQQQKRQTMALWLKSFIKRLRA